MCLGLLTGTSLAIGPLCFTNISSSPSRSEVKYYDHDTYFICTNFMCVHVYHKNLIAGINSGTLDLYQHTHSEIGDVFWLQT